MNNTKYVHFSSLKNGDLRLHGQASRNAPSTAIRWDDFTNALVKFGIPSLSRPTAPPSRKPKKPRIGELEEKYGATVSFAIFKLYQRRFIGNGTHENVGCVVKTKHAHGSSIVVMKQTTAAFAKSHREYTSHVENDFMGNANYNRIGMFLLRSLTSAVNDLELKDNERRFLMKYYQDMLATY